MVPEPQSSKRCCRLGHGRGPRLGEGTCWGPRAGAQQMWSQTGSWRGAVAEPGPVESGGWKGGGLRTVRQGQGGRAPPNQAPGHGAEGPYDGTALPAHPIPKGTASSLRGCGAPVPFTHLDPPLPIPGLGLGLGFGLGLGLGSGSGFPVDHAQYPGPLCRPAYPVDPPSGSRDRAPGTLGPERGGHRAGHIQLLDGLRCPKDEEG